jgi:hypothetical protein
MVSAPSGQQFLDIVMNKKLKEKMMWVLTLAYFSAMLLV